MRCFAAADGGRTTLASLPRQWDPLASFVTGRRGKFVVLGIWIVAFAALMPLGAKLADETQDDTASFLPESAESAGSSRSSTRSSRAGRQRRG